jgi:hypothetical protein
MSSSSIDLDVHGGAGIRHARSCLFGAALFALLAAAAVVADATAATALVDYSNYTLNVARYDLVATSVSNLALFGGGQVSGGSPSNVVDIFNSISGLWTTASHSVARYYLAATSVSNLALFGGGYGSSGQSNVVDIFNSISGLWTIASLSVARYDLAATSV